MIQRSLPAFAIVLACSSVSHADSARSDWALAADLTFPSDGKRLTSVRASLSGDSPQTEAAFELDGPRMRSGQDHYVARFELDPLNMSNARITLIRIAPVAQPQSGLATQLTGWQRAQGLQELAALYEVGGTAQSRKEVSLDSMGRASVLMTLPGARRKVRVNLALRSCEGASAGQFCMTTAEDAVNALGQEVGGGDKEVTSRMR